MEEKREIKTPLNMSDWNLIIENEVDRLSETQKEYSIMKILTVIAALISGVGLNQSYVYLNSVWPDIISVSDINLIFLLAIVGMVFYLFISFLFEKFINVEIETAQIDFEDIFFIGSGIFKSVGIASIIISSLLMAILISEFTWYPQYLDGYVGSFRIILYYI